MIDIQDCVAGGQWGVTPRARPGVREGEVPAPHQLLHQHRSIPHVQI